ncbi:DUF6371 domain-containing protein [Polaribacter sp.]|uniref:DUF6371 domain-containing protein n=1 Tax=Polaribacter sp. TaxID=1920175 RepID=UPI003F699386
MSSLEFKPPPIKKPSFIEAEMVTKSMSSHTINPFIKFLKLNFDDKTVDWLIERYRLGTSKKFGGSVVFWQIDTYGKVRTGKVMNYNSETGKRSNGITWVHRLINAPDFELRQCLFGLHLVTKGVTKVAVVESEKTAVLFSVNRPDIVWLATGSLSNFSKKLLEPLKGLVVKAFPDKGCYDKWLEVANACNKDGFNIQVSRIMEETEADKGADLADIKDTVSYTDEEVKFHKLIEINPTLNTLVKTFDLHDKYGKKLRGHK